MRREACRCREIALDGALADVDAELEEFTADALGAPGEILLGHAAMGRIPAAVV